MLQALAAIAAATEAVSRAKTLYDAVKGSLSSDDEEKLQASLAELRAANDALYLSVMDKLDIASKKE